MLRSEMIAAANQLRAALLRSQILEALRGQADFATALETYHRFAQAVANFSPAGHKLIEIFDLGPLLTANLWEQIAGGKSNEDAQRVKYFTSRDVEFALEKVGQIINLLSPDEAQNSEDPGRLRLFLPETVHEKSKPERIIEAIQGITLFYSALCKIEGVSENTLALAACDSGSDKSFDFTGVPQIIEQVKSLIFGIVDRVLYYRELQFGERVKRVAETLPIIAQIGDLADTKKISPEEAELLRRGIVDGATKFLETGSSIAELRDQTRYRPDALIKPAPTLLLEGPAQESPKAAPRRRRLKPKPGIESTDPADGAETAAKKDELTEMERKTLAGLLKRAGSAKN